MEENCEVCMRWQEELYWTHFQTLHFSQLLLPGFHNRLAIPQKFSTYCRRKLPKIVTLKSPSGTKYKVVLEEDDDKTLAFCCGWDKFVKDHSLQESDLLVFKFHGASEFEVLIFDADTSCERPTSYFVRTCGHSEKSTKGTDNITATSLRSPRRYSNPDAGTSLNQQNVMSPAVNDYQLDDLIDFDFGVGIDTMLNPHVVVNPTETDLEQGEPQINSDIVRESGQLPLIREGKYPLNVFTEMRGETSNNNLDRKADVEMISAGSRKSISETCKRKALSLAKRAISPNGFMVVMKRSHVISKHFLTIPMKWSAKNKLLGSEEVVMQVDGTRWHMRYNYIVSRGRGGVSSGWKKFVKDNSLCLDDVCVFEPANSEIKPLHLHVSIFRATDAESSHNG